mmetsp:Transcript_27330/g.65888  ORF Transcript_27330/g.65888 Transcript_27330/m.65888 type:complete len:191 (-) Transcript_27330:51-623(-)
MAMATMFATQPSAKAPGDSAYLRELKAKVAHFEAKNQSLRRELQSLQESGAAIESSPYMKHHMPIPIRDPRVVQVARLMDPKFSRGHQARDIQKMAAHGFRMQEQLGAEVQAAQQQEMVYDYISAAEKFQTVEPHYKREEDVWERRVEIRNLEEAMKGNIGEPMPEPVMFSEDYPNYQEGKYVRDDCWLA